MNLNGFKLLALNFILFFFKPKKKRKRDKPIYLSSRLQMFFKIGGPKNFAIFTGKQLLESFLNKVAGLKTCNIIKKRF